MICDNRINKRIRFQGGGLGKSHLEGYNYEEYDMGFEEAKEELDDTVIFSEEDLEKVRAGIKDDEESADMNR